MSTCASVVEHDLAAAEQRAERRPLPARVHQRTERERDELLGPGVAGREERREPLRGVVEDRRDDLVGSLDRRHRRGSRRRARRRRCPPGATRRPSAARSCRPCTGRSGRRPERGPKSRAGERATSSLEAGRRRRARPICGTARRGRRRSRHARRRARARRGRRRRAGTRAPSVDVAVVDVDRHRRALVAREHRLEVLDRVAEVEADVVAGPDAVRRASRARAGSRARRARRRCGGRSPQTTAIALGHGVGDALEQVGEVELHAPRYARLATVRF